MLADIKSIVQPLAETLGPLAEVVLHDFSDLAHSVVAIAGNVTGRHRGAPITDLVLGRIKAGRFEDMINYENRLEDGRVLRSSTIFLRDQSGKCVGCLCINFDITRFKQARCLLDALCETRRLDENKEQFPNDVAEMAKLMLEEAVARIGCPVESMRKWHKLEVVSILESQGFFLIKGSVEIAAETLGVSRQTVYAYLEQIRGSQSPPGERAESPEGE
ncbi:MAG: helix-turn-helix transcriptional regulator [Bacillota bacterium]